MAQKLAALEKNPASKMTLKKIEFQLKRKELEMEMKFFEIEGALKLEYEKGGLDAEASDSVGHLSIGKPRRTKMFPVGSITQINPSTCTIIVSSVRKPGSTTIIPG